MEHLVPRLSQVGCEDPSGRVPADVARYALSSRQWDYNKQNHIHAAPTVPLEHFNRRLCPPLYQQGRAAVCCNRDVLLALAGLSLVVISRSTPNHGLVLRHYS